MTKPNRTAEEAGYALQGPIAVSITNALDHLARELSAADGFAERGDSVNVMATSELTPTERAADARYELHAAVDSVKDALQDAVQAIRRLNWTTQAAMRIRAPRNAVQPNAAKLCRDGITDATRQGSLEWHDPTCMMPAAKLGLCQRHYDARRYWCQTHGIDHEREEIVVGVVRSTLEVLVRDGYGGAVHVVAARGA